MGLGADTIEALAEAPYRRAAEMLSPRGERIRTLYELRKLGVPTPALYQAVRHCGQFDVFEAVARGEITSEVGAWFLALRSIDPPWYLRLARWLFQREVRLPMPKDGGR